MGRLVDITGKMFGRWMVLNRSGSDDRNKPLWLCRCSCGVERLVSGSTLREGQSTSCGCKREDSLTKHGMCGTSEYHSWRAMINRCHNQNDSSYHLYGARGIKVCEKWHDIFSFIEDMGLKPSNKHSIERKDNNGNYEPDNCEWVLPIEQAKNRRTNVFCRLNGETMIVAEAARRLNAYHSTLLRKVNRGQIEVMS